MGLWTWQSQVFWICLGLKMPVATCQTSFVNQNCFLVLHLQNKCSKPVNFFMDIYSWPSDIVERVQDNILWLNYKHLKNGVWNENADTALIIAAWMILLYTIHSVYTYKEHALAF